MTWFGVHLERNTYIDCGRIEQHSWILSLKSMKTNSSPSSSSPDQSKRVVHPPHYYMKTWRYKETKKKNNFQKHIICNFPLSSSKLAAFFQSISEPKESERDNCSELDDNNMVWSSIDFITESRHQEDDNHITNNNKQRVNEIMKRSPNGDPLGYFRQSGGVFLHLPIPLSTPQERDRFPFEQDQPILTLQKI